jgi:flagellar export protein FliJ
VTLQRRFQFALEPVRMLRRDAERAAMKSLADELQRAAAIDRELALAEARLQAGRDDSATMGTVADLSARQRYVERMEQVVEELALCGDRQQLHVDAARREVAEAMREREALERLEHRRRGVHAAEGRRLERIEGDEISMHAHFRVGGVAA